VLATVILVVVTYAMWRYFPDVPAENPFAKHLRTLFVCIAPLAGLAAALFVVRSYTLERECLLVQRLFWSTRVPLVGDVAAWHDPSAMKRSLRVFGNGGLYSITGIFRNRTLGRYRAFVTDPGRALVLRMPAGVVVLSPDDPAAFLRALAVVHPGAKVATSGAAPTAVAQ
jgi:hypothetical protein